MHLSLAGFVADCESVIAQTEDAADRVTEVAPLMQRLLASADKFLAASHFRSDPDNYSRNAIHIAPSGNLSLFALVWLPSGVVMLIGPVVAPVGTVAVSWPKEMVLTEVELVPLNRIVGVPTLKLAPVMVTLVPTGPAPGEKPKMVGGTTKLLVVVEEPAGAITRS